MSIFGCCGMDCEACEARRATLHKDAASLAKLAAAAENAGDGLFILPSKLKCTGCLEPGVKSIRCQQCQIRLCAQENHLPHCGFCENFPCGLGGDTWEAIPEYKHNLEQLKSR